jgi:hypothetical protein
MGDEEHRRAMTLAQPAEKFAHADTGERIQRVEGLIGEQKLRLPRQRSGECDALLLAARQFAGPRAFSAREPDLGEGRRSCPPGLGIR